MPPLQIFKHVLNLLDQEYDLLQVMEHYQQPAIEITESTKGTNDGSNAG
jgi:hypothetical protein